MIQDPTLIYQMGKVASIAIESSLRKRFTFVSLKRPHFMSSARCQELESVAQEAMATGHSLQFASIKAQISLGRTQRIAQLAHIRGGKRLKIITAFREPCAHIISSFFQNIATFLPHCKITTHVREDVLQQICNEFLLFWERAITGVACSTALEKWVRFIFTHPLVWFDRELKSVFNVDLYAHSFDHSKGYQIFHFDSIDVLVFKFERGATVIEQALADFFGIPSMQLEKHNVGTQKAYAAYYQRFKEGIRVPSYMLDTLYETPYAKHFYTPNEIFKFRERWNRS